MQNSTNQPDRPRQRIAAVDTASLHALKAFAAREGLTLAPAKDQTPGGGFRYSLEQVDTTAPKSTMTV